MLCFIFLCSSLFLRFCSTVHAVTPSGAGEILCATVRCEGVFKAGVWGRGNTGVNCDTWARSDSSWCPHMSTLSESVSLHKNIHFLHQESETPGSSVIHTVIMSLREMVTLIAPSVKIDIKLARDIFRAASLRPEQPSFWIIPLIHSTPGVFGQCHHTGV